MVAIHISQIRYLCFIKPQPLKKLLIIDDDLDLLEAMSAFLQQKNYHVVAISDAEDWKETIADFQPDIIVLDILLGELDGRHICRDIKKEKQFKNIPVVLISGLAPDKVDYKKWSADAFISKPFEISAVNKTLENILKN
jgi:DNA-binding response OmpR family regulator